MGLVDKQIKHAQLTAQIVGGKRIKLYDGNGLFLEVSAGRGVASWFLKYRSGRHERRASIGRYPGITIAQARNHARDLRTAIDGGQPPHLAKSKERTFAALADEWFKVNKGDWSERHATGVERYLRYAKDAFGATAIAELDAPTVLELLRKYEARGETARRVRLYVSLVHTYAVNTGRVNTPDPAASLRRKGVLKAKARVRSHPAMPAHLIPDWLKALEASPFAPEVKAATKFTTLTALRTGEVLGLTWAEVAPDNTSVTIPADRMKGKRDHTVFLSKPARNLVDAMETIWGRARSAYVFPGKKVGEPLSNMAMSMALTRTCPKGVTATIHGMRAAFSTWANSSGASPWVVERCLAHVNKDKVAAAYNRSTYDAEAKALWEAWAAAITAK
ncbi:MAG: tyrosine-type recombinase/integrase [Lysobacter sp.]|nr:tyrosine-type recombinase/integrase [Lysobacter sp.]